MVATCMVVVEVAGMAIASWSFSQLEILMPRKSHDLGFAEVADQVDVLQTGSLRCFAVLSPGVESKVKAIEAEYVGRERLAAHGLRPRMTILLAGHYGCGKTMVAERVARNVGLPLVKVLHQRLEERTGLSRVLQFARQCRCVLLLSGSPLLAGNVGGMSSRDRTCYDDLVGCLDSYSLPGLLIATANQVPVDAGASIGLWRMFDEVVDIGRPGADEIKRLLAMSLSSIPVDDDVDWNRISCMLAGMSAKSIVSVARNAAKAAILAGRKSVAYRDLATEADSAVHKLF